MKRRIYTDTSVIGGCLDQEFADASLRLLQEFETGETIIVLSDLTILELKKAPAQVRAVLERIPEEYRGFVETTEEATILAKRYIETGIIGPGKWADTIHIALATIVRVDVLVSWNFKHIVNLQRIHGYNSVNLRFGYPMLEIRTPREVVHYGNQ